MVQVELIKESIFSCWRPHEPVFDSGSTSNFWVSLLKAKVKYDSQQTVLPAFDLQLASTTEASLAAAAAIEMRAAANFIFLSFLITLLLDAQLGPRF